MNFKILQKDMWSYYCFVFVFVLKFFLGYGRCIAKEEVFKPATQIYSFIDDNSSKVVKDNHIFVEKKGLDGVIGFLLDLLVLLFLFLGAFWGYRHGILANLVLCICCGSPFYIAKIALNDLLVNFIKNSIPALKDLAPALSFVVVVGVSFCIFVLLSKLLNVIFRRTALVYLDNILGGFFYLFFTILFLSLLVFLLEELDIELPKRYRTKMHFYPILRDVFNHFLLFLEKFLPKLEKLINAN